MIGLDPPLDPSGDEARSLLRRELVDPAYFDDNLLQRVLGWVDRALSSGIEQAGQAPPLTTLAAMVLAVLLVGGLALLLSRARRTAGQGAQGRAVLSDESVTADELRARAEAALAEGRHEDAVVDGFRALAVRQVERGRLDDTPGATAHEVASALAGEYPHQRARVDASADLFDAVLYGGRSATGEQAGQVLGLEDELKVLR